MKKFSNKFPLVITSILSITMFIFLIINNNSQLNVSKIKNRMYRSQNGGGIYITNEGKKDLTMLYKIAQDDYEKTMDKLEGGEFKNLSIEKKDNKIFLNSTELENNRLEIANENLIYDTVSNTEYVYYKDDDFNKNSKNINDIETFFIEREYHKKTD